MKASFILSIIMLCMLVAGKAQVLDNSGPLQIGKTTTTFLDSLIAHGYVFKNSNNWEEHFYAHGKILYKIEHSPGVDRRLDGSTLVVYHEKFKVGELSLWRIDFQNVLLEFYKDTLISFIVNQYPIELKKLLLSKYGQPKVGIDYMLYKCVEQGDTSKSILETFISLSNLKVIGITDEYYESSCIKKFQYQFIANKPSLVKILEEKEVYERGKLQ